MSGDRDDIISSLCDHRAAADVYRSARTGTATVPGRQRGTRQNSPIIRLFVLQAANLFTPRCILGSVILIFPLVQQNDAAVRPQNYSAVT